MDFLPNRLPGITVLGGPTVEFPRISDSLGTVPGYVCVFISGTVPGYVRVFCYGFAC
jgi:hypothetical protein